VGLSLATYHAVRSFNIETGGLVMNAISHRSTRLGGALAVLAAAVLTGCTATGGAVTSGAAANRAAAPVVDFAAQAGYIVCSGGHASRLDEREDQGRMCRPVASLQEIY
jgi:hypothetical protein